MFLLVLNYTNNPSVHPQLAHICRFFGSRSWYMRILTNSPRSVRLIYRTRGLHDFHACSARGRTSGTCRSARCTKPAISPTSTRNCYALIFLLFALVAILLGTLVASVSFSSAAAAVGCSIWRSSSFIASWIAESRLMFSLRPLHYSKKKKKWY